MKSFATILTIVAIASNAMAVPAQVEQRTGGTPYTACSNQGLYSVPQCCATDVLGVADLNCHNRK